MVIVTGTGRSGTSFMVQLLSQLYSVDLKSSFNEDMNAGLEHPSIVRFNDLWSEGKVEEAVGWFISSIPVYRSISLLKDPRFFYNNNLHYVKKHFPNLKVVWMYRNPEEVITSGEKLVEKGCGEGEFWVNQNVESLKLQNEYFKFYLEKNNITYIKINYSNINSLKNSIYDSFNSLILKLDYNSFNEKWNNLLKIK